MTEIDASACCAHIAVKYAPIRHAGGMVTDRWECCDCRAVFVPRGHQDAELLGAAMRVSDDELRYWASDRVKGEMADRVKSMARELYEARAEIERLTQERDEYKRARDELTDAFESMRRTVDNALALRDKAFEARNRAWKDRDEALSALASLMHYVKHDDNCGDSDAYNHADVPTCGCGLDNLLEAIRNESEE